MPFLQESRTPKLLRRQDLADEATRIEADAQALEARGNHYRQLAGRLQALVVELVDNPGVPTHAAALARELVDWYHTQRPPDDMAGLGTSILSGLAQTLERDVRRDAHRQGTA